MNTKIYLVLVCAIAVVCGQGFFNSIFGTDLLLDDRFVNFFANTGNLTEPNQPCLVNDLTGGAVDSLEGTCNHATECRFSGGRAVARGNCSFWHTCCIYQQTCGNTVRSRVSYFQVGNAARLANQDRTCSLTVRRVNSRISQMRVDIISMNTERPTEIPTTPPATGPFMYICSLDVFRIREPTLVPIPDLCGSNQNNHFYIHLTPGQREVNLDMLLAGGDRTAAAANWNIKITQLESPVVRTKLEKHEIGENRNQIARDFRTLAPEGCLQYFTEPSGIVQTFGYVSATDKSLSTGQNYVSCFRPYGVCGVQFTILDFVLRNMDATMCDEILEIPEGVPATVDLCVPTIPADPPMQVTSAHPGPVYIHFSNLQAITQEDVTTGTGYQLRYNRAATC